MGVVESSLSPGHHQQLHAAAGLHRGVAHFVVDERALAEEVAGAQRRHHRLAVVASQHLMNTRRTKGEHPDWARASQPQRVLQGAE